MGDGTAPIDAGGATATLTLFIKTARVLYLYHTRASGDLGINGWQHSLKRGKEERKRRRNLQTSSFIFWQNGRRDVP